MGVVELWIAVELDFDATTRRRFARSQFAADAILASNGVAPVTVKNTKMSLAGSPSFGTLLTFVHWSPVI
jgi:hypothetical protein